VGEGVALFRVCGVAVGCLHTPTLAHPHNLSMVYLRLFVNPYKYATY